MAHSPYLAGQVMTLREALKRMGREDLIGNGRHQLVPRWQPKGTGETPEGRRGPKPEGKRAAKPEGKRGTTASRPEGAARKGGRRKGGKIRTQHVR